MNNNFNFTDVTVHIDESLDKARYATIETDLRNIAGVISVAHQDKTPHLLIVGFDADQLKTHDILNHVTSHDVHAELIGL